MKRTLATLALLCAFSAIAAFLLTGCATVAVGVLKANCAYEKAKYGLRDCRIW